MLFPLSGDSSRPPWAAYSVERLNFLYLFLGWALETLSSPDDEPDRPLPDADQASVAAIVHKLVHVWLLPFLSTAELLPALPSLRECHGLLTFEGVLIRLTKAIKLTSRNSSPPTASQMRASVRVVMRWCTRLMKSPVWTASVWPGVSSGLVSYGYRKLLKLALHLMRLSETLIPTGEALRLATAGLRLLRVGLWGEIPSEDAEKGALGMLAEEYEEDDAEPLQTPLEATSGLTPFQHGLLAGAPFRQCLCAHPEQHAPLHTPRHFPLRCPRVAAEAAGGDPQATLSFAGHGFATFFRPQLKGTGRLQADPTLVPFALMAACGALTLMRRLFSHPGIRMAPSSVGVEDDARVEAAMREMAEWEPHLPDFQEILRDPFVALHLVSLFGDQDNLLVSWCSDLLNLYDVCQMPLILRPPALIATAGRLVDGLLSPGRVFVSLLGLLRFEVPLLLDLLICPESGLLLYLARVLRVLESNKGWLAPTCAALGSARCPHIIPLPPRGSRGSDEEDEDEDEEDEEGEEADRGSPGQGGELSLSPLAQQVQGCLQKVAKRLRRLHGAGAFPYNPEPLIRRLLAVAQG
ncbi:hypothetical protein PAPYR_5720 [Paratrimastix pyriformis]|uniref:Uncharacterized protein n=1 Tax=Paratrimastix pyriformis TaxID=342808 RepID=A0ABQ8UJX2_9EUKA|nr:hypothetical protein PAPYR_5720 [Paratrimastix pyriformis]